MRRERPAPAWLALPALLFLLAPLAHGRGRGASTVDWEEGSRAPVGCWLQDEGCPARTSSTASRALSGPRALAWKFQVTGDVEGDPVVWKDRTFVVERSRTKRTLHMLSTATGARLYRRTFETSLPLAPCVDDGRLVLRSSPKTVLGFLVGGKTLVSKWTLSAKQSIGPPTLLRDEVYVVVDGVLERRTFGAKAPVWPAAKAKPTVRVEPAAAGKGAKSAPVESPRPSVRGPSVFLATGRRLVEADRSTGSVLREASLAGDVDPATSRVLVGFCDVLVERGGGTGIAEWFGRTEGSAFAARVPLSLRAGAASLGCDWVCLRGSSDGGTSLVRLPGPGETGSGDFDFATAKRHPEFLAAGVSPSAANDVVHLGGRTFDADRLELLEPDPVPSVARNVPLGDRLIVVEGRNRVTAWKSARARDAGPPFRSVAPGAELPPAHALLEDGRLVRGGLAFDPKTGALRGSGKPGDAGAWPAAQVLAIVADGPPRRVLLAASPADAVTAVGALGRAAAGAETAAMVERALAAGVPDVAERALAAAARLGAEEASLDAAEAALAAAKGRSVGDAAEPATEEASGGDAEEGGEGLAETDAVREARERLDAELATLVRREADAYVEAAEGLPADAPLAYGIALVRAAVAVYAYHGPATAWVRARLPEGLAPPTIRDLREWLDFLEMAGDGTIEVYPPGTRIPDSEADVVDAVASARAAWRPDLAAFRHGPLLVVATGERPDLVARFLLLGRVVADVLAKTFEPMGPPREEPETLVLHFFPTKGEYLMRSHSGEPDRGFGGLENTAGHYDPRANVTRMFVSGSADLEDTIAGVYAHELTHHWVSRRRPPREGDEGDRAGGPGYWVVEGIADFVQGFDFDVAAGKATLQNPRADYADTIAHAKTADLLPWASFLDMPQREAYALLGEGSVKIPMRWRMDVETDLSKGNLYYAQAAATTAWLFLGEGGKNRKAFFDHLYDHYAGEADSAKLLRAVGLTADQVGERVVRWCREVVAGAPRETISSPPPPR